MVYLLPTAQGAAGGKTMKTTIYTDLEQAEIRADELEARGLDVEIVARPGGYEVVRRERDLRGY